mmetsp:Transcript_7650/g.10902  ORF Transcript_7650/g.10902 Transcript_7650/m.10902 type:complete len:295 (-) Transcript_7650:237-1121(-)
MLYDCLFPCYHLCSSDKLIQGCGVTSSSVELSVPVLRVFKCCQKSGNNVRYVNPCTSGCTISKFSNWLIVDNTFDQNSRHHVWPASWSVRGKYANKSEVHVVEMRVTMCHGISSDLACTVWVNGASISAFVECYIIVGTLAKNTSSRSLDNHLDSAFAKCIQKFGCTEDIYINILFRKSDASSIVNHSTNMNTTSNTMLLDSLHDFFLVTNVSVDDTEECAMVGIIFGSFFQKVCNALFFITFGCLAVEDVVNNNLTTLLEQFFHYMAPNKANPSSHHDTLAIFFSVIGVMLQV